MARCARVDLSTQDPAHNPPPPTPTPAPKGPKAKQNQAHAMTRARQPRTTPEATHTQKNHPNRRLPASPRNQPSSSPPEETPRNQPIPTITGGHICNDTERKPLPPPTRHGEPPPPTRPGGPAIPTPP